ncbi:MAG: TonB-dependent receptor [Chitinophagaceae bacterium]|nr:TonB-dependent receptor [Chitinophagaceae bacterium]
MKKIVTLLSGVFFLLISFSSFSQKGNLKIKVTDDQNLNMPGATISLNNSKQAAYSDYDGELILLNLVPGDYEVKVSYIGYSELSKTVKIEAGKTEYIRFTMQQGATLQKEILVLGDRLKGQAKALNKQKNNFNITNVVAADQIGRFPDANIGDAIKRIPGITMQNDQGEARNIIIRGMGPELNSVTLNGERIPSAEGDNRRVQMDLIPADVIQTVEVNKTLTPDMDADAIGGSVNLIPRSAANGFRLSGTLAGGYNSIRNSFIGTAGLVVGNRFANDKLGIILSGSFNTNDYGSDNTEALWAKDANGKLYISDHDIRVYDVKRIRRALTATVDYKFDPRNSISLTGSYNWRDDKENRFRLRHRFRGNASNLIYDAGGNITGYTAGEVLRQTKGGVNSDRGESRRLEDQRVKSLMLKGDHIWGAARIDWSTSYARASELRPGERYISLGRRSITVTQDISDKEFPLLTDTRPLSDYTRFNELTEQFQDQYERDLNSKLNIEIPASIITGQKGALKFGARLRAKKKVRDNNFFSYEPTSAAAPQFANISLLPLVDKTNADFYPGSKFAAGQFVDPSFLGGLNFNNAAQFDKSDEPAEYLAINYNAKETIAAGYVQLKQQFSDQFSVLLGLRVEHTSTDYTGNVVEDEDDLKEVVNLKNNYTNLLPGINLRYQVNGNFILRAAWTNAIARPKYYDLVPYFNVNPNDNELSSGNPSLEPVRSSNFDLMAENYFKSIGLISGGIFYKKLDKFFYRYRDDNYTNAKFAADFPTVTNPITPGDTWAFTQPRNGSSVNVFGFEVALQRQFDFLPGFWKGFGIYTNYTFTTSKAKGIYDGSGTLIRENVKLPGTAPHTFNASLSYENKKLVLRLSANYTAAYVDDSDDAGYNEDAFFDRYYDKQFFLDANASFAFTPRWRVFAEANNLTNQSLRYYQGVKERTGQVEFYGPRFNLGVKFDLNK